MRFLNVATTVFLASAGFAAAAGKCDAQDILDSCLKTTEAEVKKCSSNDWKCLCQEYTDVLTCYNNCPDDEGRSGVQSQVTANCNAAKSYDSSSSSASSPEPTKAPTNTDKGKASGGNGGDEEPTATESGASETSTGAASGITFEAGGVVAAISVGLGAWL